MTKCETCVHSVWCNGTLLCVGPAPIIFCPPEQECECWEEAEEEEENDG